MKRMKLFLLPALVIFLLASCRKDPSGELTLEDTWVYISSGENSTDFSSYTSVAIPDSVVYISNQQNNDSYETDTRAQAMIAAVSTTLDARGYTVVSRESNPDLGISIARIDNSYTNVGVVSGWWDPYYGYWDSGYWGYPGYGWSPYGWSANQFVFYNTNESAWAIDIIDLKNTSGNSLNILWSGTIRGEEIFDPQYLSQLVQGLFETAPYIRKN